MSRQFNKILVTAALPYANGKIHLGHLAGAYLPADVYVRYQRLLKRDIIFICGSDEHGVPITITAEQEKTTPQAIVDRYHELNKKAFEQFGMSFDNYSRTSLSLHHETASEFFLKLYQAGILKEKKEKQLYDMKAGMFLPDRYVEGTCPVCSNPDARGDQCEKCGTFLNPIELKNPRSKISGETPTVKETTHLYFPLGDYQKKLEDYIAAADARDGWKDNVLQYCRSWFKDGLQDRAVTRDLQWGVKVPLENLNDKVLYVWFDAVLGYISSTKELSMNKGTPDLWKDYWLDPKTKYVAFIGKDNVVFHCIVFPAMLMAWNEQKDLTYILPENVPANEFLNFEGQKFSKSRGWGIDVDEFLAEFPADALRYTLTMNLPELRDADFYWKDFQARVNNELADILGNFINRTVTFVHKNFEGKIPERGILTESDDNLVSLINSTSKTAGELFEKYKLRDATLEIMNLARAANKYFNDNEPWKTLKTDRQRCSTTLHICLHTVRALSILFEPILPFSVEKIWKIMNLQGSVHNAEWETAGALVLKAGDKLNQPEILFTKIEDETIDKHISQLPSKQTTDKKPINFKPTIAIEDFQKIDLRVAEVIQAEKVQKSDKLLKLMVRIGTDERQVIAGIAQYYKPEELVGKRIVVVVNLAPAKLMGQESRGMLLAASDDQGQLAVLIPEKTVLDGGIVK
ncbi:MAG: methionine--tRNA ligase [Ignavibacteriales bacterium]|nr:methionine--tRNA ligase [Ignavibacteriales bacterium]